MANSTGFDRSILDAAGLRLAGGEAIPEFDTPSSTFGPGGMSAAMLEEGNLEGDQDSGHRDDTVGDAHQWPVQIPAAGEPARQNSTDLAEISGSDLLTTTQVGGTGPDNWTPRAAASIEITAEPTASGEEELVLTSDTAELDSATKTKQSSDTDGALLAKTSAASGSGGATTLIVTTASDEAVGASLNDDLTDGGGLSLREAINWNVTGDTIGFDAALTGLTLTLSGGELALTRDICIHGDIDGDGKADITLSGGNASRVFNISGTGTDADLLSLTLTNGSATSGGAILTNSGTTLNLINSTIQNSSATHGGALLNDGALTIVSSSITGNTASAYGGGLNIGMYQSATLINTTVYGNTSGNDGGGIYARLYSLLDIYNSSITSNTAGFVGGGIALFESSTATIANSVVALNDGFGGAIADDVSATGAYTALNADSSFFGNTVTIDSGANNTNNGGDPLLGQLLDNGGTVMTRSPLDGSLLIGAGDTALLPLDIFDLDEDGLTLEDLSLDARNEARVTSVLDIGAVEQIANEVISGTSGNDILDGGTGDDILIGNAGNDTLDGGDDTDTASYVSSAGAVLVDLTLQGTAQNTGTASGMDTLVDIENVTGSAFADTLTGDSQSNILDGGDGSDLLTGGLGNDLLDGGADADTAVINDLSRAAFTTRMSSGDVYVGSSDGKDILKNVEILQFTDGVSATAQVSLFNGLEYIASHGDLRAAFGANATAGEAHFIGSGFIGGRTISFDGLEYIASHSDLINVFGADRDAGATHFINAGSKTGRTTSFDGLEYIASHSDLINVFGADRDAGSTHFITAGFGAGRTTSFDGLEYIASYSDLINAFGADRDAGSTHFITAGFSTGRTTSFDGLEYIASYGDLINVFGAGRDAGSTHFINAGFGAGRETSFDGLEYIASYSDLINAFGADRDAGSTHFINAGFGAGRSVSFNGLDYLASYNDLMAVFGAEGDAGSTHFINAGFAAGRSASLRGAADPLTNAVQGSSGADTLNGTAQADLMAGQGGADTLNGSAGDDVMFGGTGADVFVFAAGQDANTVLDFNDGIDLVDIQSYNFTSTADFSITDNGGNALIDLGGGTTVELENLAVGQLSDADFMF